MLKAFYLKHDENASHDPKVLKMRLKYGLEGYAMYWILLENMRQNDGYLNFDDVPSLAQFEMHKDEAFLAEFIRLCIEGYGLFEGDEKRFWSNRLKADIDDSEERQRRRQESGRKGGFAKAKASNAKAMPKQSHSNAKEMPNQCSSNALATREEKTRQEKTREFLSPVRGQKDVRDAQGPTAKDRKTPIPTLEEVQEYIRDNSLTVSPERFFYSMEAKGWQTNGNPIADWQSMLRAWEASGQWDGKQTGHGSQRSIAKDITPTYDPQEWETYSD